MYNMDEFYKISSTERVKQLEKELAIQLAELKTEIEDNGVLPGIPNRAYSSVRIPKDVSYFRKEREVILKKSLQIAEAKPLVVQADVMQRELESCLRREYTAEGLPLLLHQKQIGHIMQEYNDALQRAARLSAARQNFLTGKKNPFNIVTQEDLIIYMQWLVCHLHSLKPIHSYLRRLQYLPLSHRMEVVTEKHHEMAQDNGGKFRHEGPSESLSSNIHFSLCLSISGRDGPHNKDAVVMLPQHTTETEELKPQLRLLLSHFGICYDVENLKNSANEMELFSLVVQKFRSVFSTQQKMRTFPVYDTEVPGSENWGMLGPSMALKKSANWIPFIKIKPKQDPWQQKLLTKLKQWKKVDVLLHLQSKFLEVSNMEQVMDVLQEHATEVLEPSPLRSSSVASRISGQHDYDKIWERIYNYSELHQDQNSEDNNPAVAINEKGTETISLSKNPGSCRKRKERGYSYVTALHLLGLDEGTETNSKDLIMRKGAYLSTLYLRHLRIRELQRVCLGILNYFRSVERTLTISTSGLTLHAGNLVSSAEDTCWVNAVKGGIGVSGGLGSRPYIHYTPADFKVHSAQFMEFSEVENHDDFYTIEDGYIHIQDQRGAYIMYDVALMDLKNLENQMLLVASQYIEKDKGHITYNQSSSNNFLALAHASVDRSAVLLDLWTCEAALLQNKRQLLDGYFEAYQHALDAEERFALGQAITDIMHKRPRFDLNLRYFVNTYNDECICLRLQLQLVREILNQQIDAQREYVQKIWHKGQEGGISEFGLPQNIITKQLISLNNSCPALKNIYLLEFHPSLGLASLIPKALDYVLQEFYNICRPKTPRETTNLEKQVLQLAVDEWLSMEKPESSYSPQIQKDLFADTLMEDPRSVRDIALLALELGADEEKKQGREKHAFMLDTFSRLLELITVRHRLIETAMESAYLARMYKVFAGEMGFGEFHLYLRPVHFEFASHKDKVDQLPPIFITALLEDDSSVDRYSPSNLLLSIQEIDNQIGKFSFHTRDGIVKLMALSGVENMQITLACQVAQKNVVLVAVQQASFCPVTQPARTMNMKEGNLSLKPQSSSASGRNSRSGKETENRSLVAAPATLYSPGFSLDGHGTIKRPPEAFVSIQLEKLGPRDMMLNTFIHKKEIMGSRMQNPDVNEKIKREVITEYCHKLSHRMSQHALRGQIIAYYNSLRILLEDFPVIRDKYFMIGLAQEKKSNQDSKEKLKTDPRSFQPRPRCLLSSDGQAFLNLWFIPHSSEVLIMFKLLPEKAACRALRQSLQIVAALHDIISYLFSFAQLGNSPNSFDSLNPEPLTADWGGNEKIGIELQELQKMIDSLQDPLDPNQVAQLLIMQREVMFLQFDATLRHLLREVYFSSGNTLAYQSITEGMHHGLPPLSNSAVRSVFASQLHLPWPLDPHSPMALLLFPWRAFLADGGPFSVTIGDLNPINYNMQLCLCRLSDEDRRVAHGELIGMQFLMEDVLQSGCDDVKDRAQWQTTVAKQKQNLAEMDESYASWSRNSRKTCKALPRLHDPITSCALLRSFLITWKQLEVLKAEWGRLKLKVEDINTVPLYKQFAELYGTDILYPAMRALARQMGTEDEFEGLVISSQSIVPPKGASEMEVKTYQLQKLLESLEIHMIHDVQKKINQEMTLVTSERARAGSSLPTELWKHQVMQESFSVVRPHIAEAFFQRLMENYQESDIEITFKKSHLQNCLTALGCDIMARERSNFETYSMFYENLLQQEHQLLYQKEQELHAVEESGRQTDVNLSQIAELSHEMIMEVTALRARLTNLGNENLCLKERIRKEVQDEYGMLVRNLFMTCLHLKGKLDDYRLNMSRQVFKIISEVRKEGVDNMIGLKKKFGSTKNDDGLKEHLSKQEQLEALQKENGRLGELVCKLKVLSRWKQTIQKEQLSVKLRNAEKEAFQNKEECLNAKMLAEQEVLLFRQQLLAARKALVALEAENERLKKQLEKQKDLLQEAEHRMTQESRSRQQLDVVRAANMEKMLQDIGEKEQRLECLTKDAEKSSKIVQLQQKRLKKEMQQVRSQLTQERSLKLDAFQRVKELQCQVYDLEAVTSQRNSFAGMKKSSTTLMTWSASSTRRPLSGSTSWGQSPGLSASTLPRDYKQKGSSLTSRKTERPKTVSNTGLAVSSKNSNDNCEK